MSVKAISTLLLGLFAVCSYAKAFVEGGVASSDPSLRFEPQIAMVCDARNQYHAQYMSESGRWITDNKSKVTCLKNKVDILEYCKKVYPDKDITNIVEASHYYKVPNFCKLDHKCKTSIWVKPYRCLEGMFQSDALLVPEGCLFDHIHNQTHCWEFDQWNSTADQACQARHLNLKSFAMLLPCGIDVFSGVEFVCCPNNYKNHGKVHTMELEEPLALPKIDRRAEPSPPSTTKIPATTPVQEIGTRDEYFSRFDPHEEHDAFRRAEQRLEDRHRQKVAKIMKEWSDLEERYQDLHSKDPKGAEEFKVKMTQRFQQTVQALEAENEAEKHQLTALHQQRIVAHINEIKREAMNCYTQALNSDEPNTHKVQKCLQKLLRALNKDRHHTVSHFKHLLNSDYESADKERDSTLQHLADLDKMVNQSLNMLSRYPELYAKIGHLMHEYASALRSKDTTPPELTPQPPHQKMEETIPEEDYDDDDEDDEDDSDEEEDSKENEIEESNENKPTNTEEPESHETMDKSTPESPKELPIDQLPPRATVHKIIPPKMAHAQRNVISHEASYTITADDSNSSSGVIMSVAFGGVALMVAMVIGIVILRRRNGSHPHSQGFMEVDQAATPEEKHVTNMQVNGYENPTYKYFEK